MIRKLSVSISLLLMSGCATMNEDNQTQLLETQPIAAPIQGKEPADSKPPIESVENGLNQSSTTSRPLSKQEIRSLQIKLKAVGFDPGASDGVLGSKTIWAFRRMQAACVNLKDLLEYSVSGIQSANQNGRYDRNFSPDDTRMLQTRLNDAGFNVGTIDGVMGHKTRAAVIRVQSGCIAIKDLPGSLENSGPIEEVHRPPLPGFERQAQSDPSKRIPAAIPATGDTNRSNAAEEQTPSKDEVYRLQEQLRAAGFDPGPLDGILGTKTRSALQQYRAVTGPSTEPLSSSIKQKSYY